MEFEKDARKSGVASLLFGIVVLVAAGALQIFFFSKMDMSIIVKMAVWLVVGLVGFIFLWQGTSLIVSGGRWRILINEDGVSWESPNQSVDRSFNLRLSEIDRIETRIRQKKGKMSSTRRYILVTHSGQEQKLSPNSGINLAQVVTTLERFGVKSETIKLT